jgi:hypothetical protein
MGNRIVIAVCMLFVGLCMGYIIGHMSQPTKVIADPYPLHPYDYIMEVDGTDSVSIYTIYNQDHSVVGSFSASNCDSLDVIITEDNL